jgi:hypothetical protein
MSVERQSRLEIPDLEGDVVDADQARAPTQADERGRETRTAPETVLLRFLRIS